MTDGARLRMLICDDHQLLASSLATRFRSRGHTVHTVASPPAALAHLHRHTVDLCLMDLRFPGAPLGGLNAITAVRTASPDTVVILVSAALDRLAVEAAVRAGAHGVARKDTSLEAFECAVLRAGPGTVLLPADFASAAVRRLSPQEGRVLELVEQGRSTAYVAAELGLSVATVRAHLAAISAKLRVTSRVHAINVAGPSRPQISRLSIADSQC
jgi:two-component system, NarL family, nitrate/nitrite response regulator NarL